MSDYETLRLLNDLSKTGSSSTSGVEGAGIWLIIASILAVVGGILVYFLFVKAKAEPQNKFLKWLKDFLSFKVMWIEPILKVVYSIATIFIVLNSFSFLALGGNGVLMWLATLVLGPVILRVLYEATMMFIMIWRNTRDIADNAKKK